MLVSFEFEGVIGGLILDGTCPIGGDLLFWPLFSAIIVLIESIPLAMDGVNMNRALIGDVDFGRFQ